MGAGASTGREQGHLRRLLAHHELQQLGLQPGVVLELIHDQVRVASCPRRGEAHSREEQSKTCLGFKTCLLVRGWRPVYGIPWKWRRASPLRSRRVRKMTSMLSKSSRPSRRSRLSYLVRARVRARVGARVRIRVRFRGRAKGESYLWGCG